MIGLRLPTRPNVVVILKGGLGNQLLQLAAGLSVARRTRARLVLDTHWFSIQSKRTLEIAPVVERLRGVSLREGAADEVPVERHHEEQSFLFDPRVDQLEPPVVLNGHFPSPRYVEPALAELRQLLLGDRLLHPSTRALLADWPVNSTAVHVRRGDYVTEQSANAHHGLCSLDYYRRAWALVRRLVPNAAPIVFSDDVAWTRANLRFESAAEVHYVDPHPEEPPLQSLLLMARASHWILANSTYSWWGATLGRRDGAVAVTPRPWWASTRHPERDLLWPDWIALERRADTWAG